MVNADCMLNGTYISNLLTTCFLTFCYNSQSLLPYWKSIFYHNLVCFFIVYSTVYMQVDTRQLCIFKSCKKNSHLQHLSQVALTHLCLAHHRQFCTSLLHDSTTAYSSLLMKEFSLSFAHYSLPVCQYNLYSLLVKVAWESFLSPAVCWNELYCSSLKVMSFILKRVVTPVKFTKTFLSLHLVWTSSIGHSRVVESFNNMLSRRRVLLLQCKGIL